MGILRLAFRSNDETCCLLGTLLALILKLLGRSVFFCNNFLHFSSLFFKKSQQDLVFFLKT